MNHKGFTIIELIIVISIMGILLVLGVTSFGSSQANARDSERNSDVESIAFHLETYYKTGDDASTSVGHYPSTVLVNNSTNMTRMLRDIDTRSITAPGITVPTDTFKAATNNVQTTAGVTPQPTKDQYIYQPIQSDGNLCTTETQSCRKFNIYYKLENPTSSCSAPNNICIVTSKNQ